MSERQITLVIEANGTPIKSVTGESPLRQLKLKVTGTDSNGRDELLLNFELDVRPKTGHKPELPDPE